MKWLYCIPLQERGLLPRSCEWSSLINFVLRCSSILKFLLCTPEPKQRKAITMVSNLFVAIFFSPSEIKSRIASMFFPTRPFLPRTDEKARHLIRHMAAVICLCSEAERRRAAVFKSLLTPQFYWIITSIWGPWSTTPWIHNFTAEDSE